MLLASHLLQKLLRAHLAQLVPRLLRVLLLRVLLLTLQFQQQASRKSRMLPRTRFACGCMHFSACCRRCQIGNVKAVKKKDELVEGACMF